MVGLPERHVIQMELATTDVSVRDFIRGLGSVYPSSMTARELMKAIEIYPSKANEEAVFQASVRFHNIRIKAEHVLRPFGLAVDRDGGTLSSRLWLSPTGDG